MPTVAVHRKEQAVIRLLVIITAALVLSACDSTEVQREIGYKGIARINPWLASERFLCRMGFQVRSVISWTAPTSNDSVWIIPASILNNEGFTRRFETWVQMGGHLILLVEFADESSNDWSRNHPQPVLQSALLSMLKRSGLVLTPPKPKKIDTSAREIKFNGLTYCVDAQSNTSVAILEQPAGVFASVTSGNGRITVLTDGRLFRNRWIADNENAALLNSLVMAMNYHGPVAIMRSSGLSFWKLLIDRLWPVLLVVALSVLLWLWKNLTRFGPVEAADARPELMDYSHHLDAIGDFHWRFDRSESLISPLRQKIVELGLRCRGHDTQPDLNFYQFLSSRSGLPHARVSRALTEAPSNDRESLAHVTADLQQLLKVLHNPPLP